MEDFKTLWKNIQKELNVKLPNWCETEAVRVANDAVTKRKNGTPFSDVEIWAGFVKGVLSNQTDFSKIERVLPELGKLFANFSLSYYAGLTGFDICRIFIPWFRRLNAASMTLQNDLIRLISTARLLRCYSHTHGSLENFFSTLLSNNNNDPILLAFDLGADTSKYKLPGLGIALASESLRNIGFDISKPDRHINRFVGSLGLVHYSKWVKATPYSSPETSNPELIQTMRVMQLFSKSVGVSASYLDASVWLLCAISGCHLNNMEIADTISDLSIKRFPPYTTFIKSFQVSAIMRKRSDVTIVIGGLPQDQTRFEKKLKEILTEINQITTDDPSITINILSFPHGGTLTIPDWFYDELLKRNIILTCYTGTNLEKIEILKHSNIFDSEKTKQNRQATNEITDNKKCSSNVEVLQEDHHETAIANPISSPQRQLGSEIEDCWQFLEKLIEDGRYTKDELIQTVFERYPTVSKLAIKGKIVDSFSSLFNIFHLLAVQKPDGKISFISQ